jgi:hypothetical protein
VVHAMQRRHDGQRHHVGGEDDGGLQTTTVHAPRTLCRTSPDRQPPRRAGKMYARGPYRSE